MLLVLVLLSASRAASPATLASLLFLALVPVAAMSGARLRPDIAALTAVWALVVFMFGLPGAGYFILAHAMTFGPIIVLQRVFGAAAVLLFAVVVGALLGASGAPVIDAMLGPGWSAAGPLVLILALGAPGVALHQIAASLCGRERAAEARLLALAPLLVGMVLGGAIGGLAGAAAAYATGSLGTPLILLLAPGPEARRRRAAAARALGVLAAGLVTCATTVAALRFAGDSWAATAPAAGLGLVAGLVALRVHAPTVARSLGRYRRVVHGVTPVTEPAAARK